jgi:hypothetical protein
MASKQLYPCFACRKAGYEIPVYLDGKDEQGRTKYLNEDGTKHVHKTRATASDSRSDRSSDEAEDSVKNLLVTINEKLDRLLNLAERK